MTAAVAIQRANSNEGYHPADSFQRHLELSGLRNTIEVVSPSSKFPPPNPLTGNDARPARVPIPSQNSTLNNTTSSTTSKETTAPSPVSGSEPAMVASASGPMSTSVVVPSRPRPGRKPIQYEDASNRRRTQNREAQRNFRDKRQQKLADAIAENAEQRAEYQRNISALDVKMDNMAKQFAQEKAQLVRDIAELQKQLQTEIDRRIAAEKQTYSHPTATSNFRSNTSGVQAPSSGHNQREYSARSPPSDEAMEIDFTSWGQNKRSRMEFETERDHCGFCTDVQNCACISSATKTDDMPPPPPPLTGAGNCALCLKDPIRAQQCRDMAANVANVGNNAPGISGGRKSCSSMIDDFNKFGQRTASISTLFGGRQVNAYPASNGAGYDIEEQQAADALESLRRHRTKAEDDARKDSGVN